MKILVGCETSGEVRNAFRALGHEAYSCDILPADDGSKYHIQGNVADYIDEGWDMGIFHPPCTRLANSGVRWLNKPPEGKTLDQMWDELYQGADLFSMCLHAPIEKICVENPVMHKHAKAAIHGFFPATQSIQPWQFGHPDKKRTCLWLKNLPELKPTKIIPEEERVASIHLAAPSPDRWKIRSKTFTGIAKAMADQWG